MTHCRVRPRRIAPEAETSAFSLWRAATRRAVTTYRRSRLKLQWQGHPAVTPRAADIKHHVAVPAIAKLHQPLREI
jgi:hypothetical protein